MQPVWCQITERSINPMAVFDFISEVSHGAQTLFFGAVRGKNRGRDVVAVGYDAAIPLAQHTLHIIADEVRVMWGDSLRVCVYHRVGKLLVGDISVAIGVSSPHRDESYLASRYIIEQIKSRAPIWKKEFYSDGETEWLKGHALCQHSQALKEIEK